MPDNPRHPRAPKPADEPDQPPDLLPEPEPAPEPAPAAPRPPERAPKRPAPPDDDAEKALAAARSILKDVPPDFRRPPNSRALDAKVREKLGKQPGVARLDIDPKTGATHLVYFDAKGNPLD